MSKSFFLFCSEPILRTYFHFDIRPCGKTSTRPSLIKKYFSEIPSKVNGCKWIGYRNGKVYNQKGGDSTHINQLALMGFYRQGLEETTETSKFFAYGLKISKENFQDSIGEITGNFYQWLNSKGESMLMQSSSPVLPGMSGGVYMCENKVKGIISAGQLLSVLSGDGDYNVITVASSYFRFDNKEFQRYLADMEQYFGECN